MLDLNKTVELVKGGLLQTKQTWTNYLGENPSWQKTAAVLAGPLIVVHAIVAPILGRIMNKFGFSIPKGILLSLISGIIGIVVMALVINFLAGLFKGKSNFNRAFAAVSLASIPGFAGAIVGSAIPWIGWLFSLAGGIVSLVFLWQIIPQALEVPEEQRVVHYVLSLLGALILAGILNMIVGYGTVSRGDFDFGGLDARDMGRQEALAAAAGNDQYKPPKNGKLSAKQVKRVVTALEDTKLIQERYALKAKELAEKLQDKENASFSDLTRIAGATRAMASLADAEMVAVKKNDGNWAEHEWVKEQLFTAFAEQDTNEAVEHNYKLFKKYEEQLNETLFYLGR